MLPGKGDLAATCALGVAALALLVPTGAAAATEDVIAPSDTRFPSVDSGWQAGTCNAEPCSVDTPERFFEQAAAHPNWGFTQFIVRNNAPGETPVGELKEVLVDLPVGLSVNPGATPRCPLATFEASPEGCPDGSEVGASAVTASLPPLGLPIAPIPGLTEVPVYNVVPVDGEVARFGFDLAGNEVFLEADVAWHSDYHESFTIEVPKAIPVELAPLVEGLILKNRLFFDGRAGDGTFLTLPSTCFGGAYAGSWKEGEPPNGPSGSAYSTLLRAGSYEEFAQPGYTFPQSAEPPLESPIPPGTSPKDCASIPYDPSIGVAPQTSATSSPSGPAVDIDVPHLLPDFGAKEREQDSSTTRAARVTLPRGYGINPSAAAPVHGLQTCTDAQFGKGTRNPVQCPPGSKIGTVTIESPPLPEGDVVGDVYVGQQLSRDPLSGNEYRIFIDGESPRYGISVRLIGNVSANPLTGQLTTTIADAPQVPFTSFELDFSDGAGAVLSSPPTCGPNRTATRMTPWSGDADATPGASFALAHAPGGGPCAPSMAARPFLPSFALAPRGAKAGAYSPLSIRIARADGQQELKGAEITLPPGLTGRLAGIPYCSEAALAAAAAGAGAAEQASPACGGASGVGRAVIEAGTGPTPLRIADGKVFLSGPYKGAPLSLAVVTPATAGPFDLGTVVVRVALFVDPETAQVTAVSDPVPDVFGGAQLSIRSVDIALDRPRFSLNPTSCELLAANGALRGGADPTIPAAFSALAVSAPFQTVDCKALGFRPKLFTRLFGGRKKMRRNANPKFRAVLVNRQGDANIRRAALTLPHSQFLDQSHIRTICTRPRLAAGSCPKGSIYGHALAETPLLDEPLRGPVYLVSSDNELPDLLADLRGQVNVRLRGVISSAKARMKTVFRTAPDVPVSRFVLTMKGGRRGLLVNSRNLCGHPNYSFLNFKAHNGEKLKKRRLPLRVPACSRKSRGSAAAHGRGRD